MRQETYDMDDLPVVVRIVSRRLPAKDGKPVERVYVLKPAGKLGACMIGFAEFVKNLLKR